MQWSFAFPNSGLLSSFSSTIYSCYSWPFFSKELLIKGCKLSQILHIKLLFFFKLLGMCRASIFALQCSFTQIPGLFISLSFFFFPLPSHPARWISCQILFAQTDSYRGLGEKARFLHIHSNKQNQNVKARMKYITVLLCQIFLISPG